jgi:excisionase family DNA binding protein
LNQLACTQKEASKMLGVSISTVSTYVKSGLIKSVKVGTRTLIIISSLYELLGEKEPNSVNITEEYYKIFSDMDSTEKIKEMSKLMELSIGERND